MLFIYDPDCKNCRTVKAWLDKHGVEYTERDLRLEPVTAQELLEWSAIGRLPLRAFLQPERFSLRALLLGNRLTLAEREMRAYVIAGAPEFIPHPMMVGDDFVVMGLNNAKWREALKIQS